MTSQQKNPVARKPEVIGLEITRQCNLTCPHCYTAATRREYTEISTSRYRELIDELAELQTRMIGWTGGEPLLREDLTELIVYAGEKGIKSGITTNGVLLDSATVQCLKDAGIRTIQISIDGTTAEKNARMRRTTEEEFARIMDGVRFCHELGIRTNLAMVLGHETLDDAPEMLKLARREGIEAVRFCGFVPQGRGKARPVRERMELNGDRARLHNFVTDMVYMENPHVMFDPAVGPLPPDYYYHECMAGMSTFYITCIGDVYPCTALLAPRFKVGNIHERPLADIWNDPKMTAMATMDRSKIEGHCSTCRHFNQCQGACRGVTFAHTGSLNASFPFCLSAISDNQ